MQIIALQEYTDKYISLYEGEIRNLNKEIAERLIEQGIVREHDNIEDESSSDTSTSSPKIIELNVSTDAETGEILLLPCCSDNTIDENYMLKHGKDLFLINTEAGNRVFANVILDNQNHLSALHWQELRYYSNKLSLVQYDMAIDDFPSVTIDFTNIYPREQ